MLILLRLLWLGLLITIIMMAQTTIVWIDLQSAHDIARRVRDRVLAAQPVWGNYTLDLTLEGLLAVGIASKDPEFIEPVWAIIRQREWTAESSIAWQSQPFNHINYQLWQLSGDYGWLRQFLVQSERYRTEVVKSAEGIMLHPLSSGPPVMLIDALQNFVGRMARAGVHGLGPDYTEAAVDQLRIYRAILRDPDTGLWAQGRGFQDDRLELSPGAWSRGQGWLTRGLIDALEVIPQDDPRFAEIAHYFREVMDAVLPLQDAQGMWHQLLSHPLSASTVDTSGTGMLIYHLARGIRLGVLVGHHYRHAAIRGFNALQHYVQANGVITDVSLGPGPNVSLQNYLHQRGHVDQHYGHGSFSVLMACAGMFILAEHDSLNHYWNQVRNMMNAVETSTVRLLDKMDKNKLFR